MSFLLAYSRFQAQVDRGEIIIDANEWPAFLYDEEQYDENKEWVGLFLGETFVRVSLPKLPFHSTTHNVTRHAYAYWLDPQPLKSGRTAHPPPGHMLPHKRKVMPIETTSHISPEKSSQASCAR